MPSTQDLQTMTGTVDVVPEVRRLYSVAAAHVMGSIDVLYCTVLYCTVLYCTVLYCTVLYCTVTVGFHLAVQGV